MNQLEKGVVTETGSILGRLPGRRGTQISPGEMSKIRQLGRKVWGIFQREDVF